MKRETMQDVGVCQVTCCYSNKIAPFYLPALCEEIAGQLDNSSHVMWSLLHEGVVFSWEVG